MPKFKNLPEEEQDAWNKMWVAAVNGELDPVKAGLAEHPHLLNVRHPETKQTLVLIAARPPLTAPERLTAALLTCLVTFMGIYC